MGSNWSNKPPQVLDMELVRKHFNRHASEYDEYAKVQLEMGHKLLDLADKYEKTAERSGFSDILEIGCGTGNITKDLLNRFPETRCTVIDIASSMIGKTREKLGSLAGRVSFITGDAEQMNIPGNTYDLIVSNAVFQWFNQPGQTVSRFTQALTDHGLMLFSTFASGTFFELHESFRKAHDLLGTIHMQHGQTFLSGGNWKDIYQSLPGGSFSWEEEARIECYPSVLKFLHAIQKIGAGNAVHSIHGSRAASGKKLLSEMIRLYEQCYSDKSGIRATYRLGYGIFANP